MVRFRGRSRIPVTTNSNAERSLWGETIYDVAWRFACRAERLAGAAHSRGILAAKGLQADNQDLPVH